MDIVLVDDEKHALNALKKILVELANEADIQTFDRSVNALEYAKTHHIDVAFLDITMPILNGIDLAKELKKILPKINVIFCTGYSEYMQQAINLHASGYLLKPAGKNEVKQALDELLYPMEISKAKFYAKTFGQFEFFVDGIPVKFARSKSKELLAYLISLRGASANRKEITAILFEDRYDKNTQDYLTKIYKDLITSLEMVGAKGIVQKNFNSYWVDKSLFSCDLYNYDNGDPQAINSYQGEFMSQYEWATLFGLNPY